MMSMGMGARHGAIGVGALWILFVTPIRICHAMIGKKLNIVLCSCLGAFESEMMKVETNPTNCHKFASFELQSSCDFHSMLKFLVELEREVQNAPNLP